ncbi:MAG: hypothetical protein R3E34_11945 [Rhodocyclaceae bacterium]
MKDLALEFRARDRWLSTGFIGNFSFQSVSRGAYAKSMRRDVAKPLSRCCDGLGAGFVCIRMASFLD